MNTRWRDRAVRVVLAPLIMAGGLIITSSGAASASTCVAWTGVQPPNPGSAFNGLSGVASVSSCLSWAVGSYSNDFMTFQALIVRWNGVRWTQQTSPNLGSGSRLDSLAGVAATSATNAWAVGSYSNSAGTSVRTLIEHWNGTAWQQVASPNPSSIRNELSGVAAISATNVWAVGSYRNTATNLDQTLIEHWNGTAWKRVPSPNSSEQDSLAGVAATSATNAWAVGPGGIDVGTASRTLIEHWNGTAWKRVPSPNPTSGSDDGYALLGVAATSSRNAWAVGSACTMCDFAAQSGSALVVRWNGTAWKRQSSPAPSRYTTRLNAVAAISATNVWAVGDYPNKSLDGAKTLIEHWNGTAWQQVPSPNLDSSTELNGVAASSATNVWAVGDYRTSTDTYKTLAIHCC